MNFINSGFYWHLISIAWFLFCWCCYGFYAKIRSKKDVSIISVLHLYREDWMRRMMLRENRVADINVIGNLERNASFFASSSLVIIAGILAMLGSIDKAIFLLQDMPFVEPVSRGISELKLVFLSAIFVYAFFTFTWCMRQYNFAAVVLCAAPILGERNVTEIEKNLFIKKTSLLLTKAADRFSYGLRSYYFGMATLTWFISNWLFMFTTFIVVFVLLYREFYSDILQVLIFNEQTNINNAIKEE